MEYAARILILFAHPALEKSRVNRHLVKAVQDLDGVTFRDLYETYPDFFIDVPHEQDLLLSHDVIVFQHPMYWYSTPALVKQWEDLVLEHGWAYGSRGTALEGKSWLHAITAGGRFEAYQPDAFNGHTLREFLLPLERTARLCRMRYLPPFVAAGTHRMEPDDMRSVAGAYRRLIEALRDGRFDFSRAEEVEYSSLALDRLIRTPVSTD